MKKTTFFIILLFFNVLYSMDQNTSSPALILTIFDSLAAHYTESNQDLTSSPLDLIEEKTKYKAKKRKRNDPQERKSIVQFMLETTTDIHTINKLNSELRGLKAAKHCSKYLTKVEKTINLKKKFTVVVVKNLLKIS